MRFTLTQHLLMALVVLLFVLASSSAQSVSFQGLGDLPAGDFLSVASAVSGDGSTVVGSSDSQLTLEAFRWDASRGMQGLGPPEGAT
jgi:uncharacterized membrane protein